MLACVNDVVGTIVDCAHAADDPEPAGHKDGPLCGITSW